ncbi:lipoprotein signal peptidase [Moraxella macacae 0408225]|uniref:Lipoprotein signal peptidase n=1 Tax=Moraxella macacae 0408225 TaxID=1230338 RepID=L2F780_9GAMM|nr:signal peptidase II [Moraxella macacae]ELA08892.1 lipoprotein signal peptidase [Moraxella macacae 0408225]
MLNHTPNLSDKQNATQLLRANGIKTAVVWYALAVLVIIFDQSSKIYFENRFDLYESVSVIDPVLNWTLAYNYGAAFSFLADQGGWQKWFFAGLASLVSLGIAYYLTKIPKHAKTLALGLGLVLGGAVGNLIDRISYGYVIDFIHVHYADVWDYPIFNIADIGVCVGVVLILFDSVFLESKRLNLVDS